MATFDDMGVWNRALTEGEIWGIYTAGRNDGQSLGEFAGVPEPATMALLALGGLMLRRKKA
jgi:hypothetical protein